MKIISQSKVKAAHSLFIVIILFTSQAQAQAYKKSVRITADYKDVTIKELLQKLSQSTHTHFIYSSSFLQSQRLVSLSLNERSLDEALKLLEAKASLNFKKQGDYIIVTPNRDLVPQTFKIKTVAAPAISDTVKISDRPLFHTYRSDQVDGSLFSREYRLHKISIDSMAIRKYNIDNILSNESHRKQKKWFASAGFFANDFSAGVEVQAGLPALFAVVNAGFLSDGTLRKSIGIGSSMSITPKLSLAAKYSFAEIKGTREVSEGTYFLAANQQQLRLSLQYSITRHIRVYGGPTLNLLTTNANFQQHPDADSDNAFFGSGQSGGPGPGGSRYTRPVQTVISSHPSDYREIKSWIGFEAGFAYSIKIFSRP
jgi:hypothetical protein